jgi:hypothetical protein
MSFDKSKFRKDKEISKNNFSQFNPNKDDRITYDFIIKNKCFVQPNEEIPNVCLQRYKNLDDIKRILD